ncbi:alpha/beta hydrolase [Planococcus sp. APC 4015]|nr:alpha/beta hydrolase [Planococcus sp. APC 4015]
MTARPLLNDPATLGLSRTVVPTRVGDVAVVAGRRTGGVATILLHGAAGSWTTWTPLLAASDLDDVIAPDLPGWGESGGHEGVRSVEDLSDAVVEVAAALGHDRWHLVGHSLGGFVALDIAARYAQQTLGVTLVSPTGASVVDAIRRPIRGGLVVPGFAGMLLAMRALARFGTGGLRIIRLLDRCGWMPALTAPLFAGPAHPSVVAAFAGEVRPAAFARAAQLASRYDTQAWTGIRCTVRAVGGARDVFADDTDAAAFGALIADFGSVRLPGAGHFAHVEQPRTVLAAMAEVRMPAATAAA